MTTIDEGADFVEPTDMTIALICARHFLDLPPNVESYGERVRRDVLPNLENPGARDFLRNVLDGDYGIL